MVNSTPRPLYLREGDPVLIVQEAGWAPGRSGRVRKISHATGIRSPDRPARSESLYRLSYRVPLSFTVTVQKYVKFWTVIAVIARKGTINCKIVLKHLKN